MDKELMSYSPQDLFIIRRLLVGKKFCGDIIMDVVYLKGGFRFYLYHRVRTVEEWYVMNCMGIRKALVRQKIKDWINGE